MRSCGSGDDSHFELGKGFIMFLCPILFDGFLGEVGERDGGSGEMRNRILIKICETNKRLKVQEISRGWPFSDKFKFVLGKEYSFKGDNKIKEFYCVEIEKGFF
jgi:hypothetical protein